MSDKPKKLKPVVGARVRLNHDFVTRGGKRYRAGVVMKIGGVDREYILHVWVRCEHHWIRVRKKDAPHMFTVISNPKRLEDE